jgi:tetraacyldisaccharide 4'-kinase
VLLARRSGCEVWTGADRAAAGRALLAARPDCSVLVSDDGLQHYSLARDVELCVVDAARGFGNGWLLPAGPLREPPSRLATVNAVVVNAGDGDALQPSLGPVPAQAPRFTMRLEGSEFRNLRDPARRAGPGLLRGKRVHAVAGIGDPQRFFRHLRAMGLEFTAHAFPDHHPFAASDLAFAGAEAVLMTEKDAVKCRSFAGESHWELPVDAVPDSALADLVLRKLDARG